ncbi:F-box protein At5g18160-like [Lotus japonicus]|uniref:F-box protein At5g18160-like n=1 Tax=Lotus japonicus TaxID=34305 RepID=UPI0025887143|nr:F-box protein At5g18160-like [Lotus japonicus]
MRSDIESSCDKVIGDINLLTKILVLVPAKHVIQCKRVSKQWRALISEPRFIQTHTHIHNSQPHSLWIYNGPIFPFHRHQLGRSDIQTFNTWSKSHLYTRIMQSCNGLLLCKAFFLEGPRSITYCFQVLNPSTNHFINLPFPSADLENNFDFSLVPAIYLSFEPLTLRSFHFKVVSFVKVNINTFKIFMYTSETSLWSACDFIFTASPKMKIGSGVYCNGVVYWCSGEVLWYFDLHNKRFESLPAPTCKDSFVKYFGEFKGNLQMILSKSDESLDFDILELEGFTKWVVRYRLNLNPVVDAFGTNIFHVLFVILQENEEDSMILFLVDSRIMSYNLKDRSLRLIREGGNFVKDCGAGKSFHLYLETLSNVGLRSP